MTFKQLILTNNWQKIAPLFLEIYPEAEKNMEGYQAVFEKLKVIDPEESDISIVISKEIDDDEEYIEACGLHKNPKNEDENYLQGIELTPWCKWLGMDISKESLNDFSELEIIVHCLYEMTFVGFSEEAIQEKINKIENNRTARNQ
ncbi:hypothetical protein ESY86_15860 [Subsaximicrobium wynnwilliamsii]|uniref:Uncharacterized protein n=1 Tax=Subsaximicrobium wynnwilliamsii TaxID=291179 RepID=A0A5C6ZE29_9FLAO|nr:DUF6557 family protein [Subsaximicrobium wynnwilliamsii]TXD82140.1 hypothetical protein ESY87_15450 [Subsaximicrobium wynnwilliamsii]TXD87785.1 hypothetical protein ESY86_15860 [Subsaximicrobium wynnwilliamsii]TXE01596.1 hypothetical protein ESY88_15440 [Subsaximicrobium wynnwilliamsii]